MNKYQQALHEAKELLPSLRAATLAGKYLFVAEPIRSILVKKGWGEVNADIENPEVEGEFATRITESGESICPESEPEKEAAMPDSNTSVFEIEDIKVVKPRRVSGNIKYPFDELEIGQSFFVPATSDRPEPWKSLAGAVTVANGRYAVPKFEDDGTTPVMRKKRNSKTDEMVQATVLTRRFALTKDTKDGVDGARMGRIEL